MQPFAKNMAVEYAAKALPDSELAKSLKDLQEGKTTIEAVTALIESGTVSNAKPIYYHGIGLTNSALLSSRYLCFHILNTDPTPFTLSSLKTWAESISGIVDIFVTGVYGIEGQQTCIPTILRKSGSNAWQLFVSDGISQSPIAINFDSTFNVIGDAVNKIN